LGIFVALLIISKLLEYPSLAIIIVFILGTGFLLYTVKKMYQFDGCQRESLLACFYLTIFSIIFEILFQQSAMSMMVFVEHNVHRHVAGWEVPAMMSQALNPLFI